MWPLLKNYPGIKDFGQESMKPNTIIEFTYIKVTKYFESQLSIEILHFTVSISGHPFLLRNYHAMCKMSPWSHAGSSR
jgi:hypothetical protein